MWSGDLRNGPLLFLVLVVWPGSVEDLEELWGAVPHSGMDVSLRGKREGRKEACKLWTIFKIIEHRSDNVMAFCYSIVTVPNKRSLHQASGSGLEPDTCIVSNCCNQWSSDCLKLFRTSFQVDEKQWCHTLVLCSALTPSVKVRRVSCTKQKAFVSSMVKCEK